MHFASYYRFLVATRGLKLPRRYHEPLLDIGTGQGHWLSMIEIRFELAWTLKTFGESKLTLMQEPMP